MDAGIPLFLYGAGDTAERVYRLLGKVKVRVTGFCVSGDPPQNERLFGKEVLSHAALQNQYGEYRILISTCMFYMQQIMEILEERQDDNLVCFFEDFERFLELYTIHEMKNKSFPNLPYGDMPYKQLTSDIAAMNEGQMRQAQHRVEDQQNPQLYYGLIDQMLLDIKNNTAEYQAIYNLLEDDISRQVLRNIALGCLCQNRKPFADAFCLNSFPDGVGYRNAQYFCDDIFHMTDQEAVGYNRIDQNGNISVRTVRLDDDIKEPITFIAMDIEGAEISALRGAKEHIIKEHPKLAVCVYHTPDALRRACTLIHEFSPRYHFYLRHHSINNLETVLYAL